MSSTVHQWIADTDRARHEEHIPRLIQIQAPALIIQTWKANLEKLIAGAKPKITDKENLLQREFVSATLKKGRGGKEFYEIVTTEGTINYFPNARFGAFVALPQSK